jgi:predicted membrane chloride channel (bestrophin family)
MIRVKATGLPRGYNNFLLALSVVFFAVASLRFTPDLGWWAPVAMGAIYHVVRMITVIGNDMQDPFGTASVTDLPAEMYCDAIGRQVKAVYDRKIILSYNLGSGPVKAIDEKGTEKWN